MNKLLYLFLFIIFLLLSGCTADADDGKREPINATDIDWEYLSTNHNDIRVGEILIDDIKIYNSDSFNEVLNIINKNKKEIKLKNSDNDDLVKVYIRFNKVGELSQAYKADEYDGKETTFYLKYSLFEYLIVKNK